jgi:hypothetical protein
MASPPPPHLILEGDSLVTILAINSPHMASEWASAQALSDVNQQLRLFPSWTALKSSRCANFYAHHIAKRAASNQVFGSIPNHSPILCSLCFRSGKDPPLYLPPSLLCLEKKKKKTRQQFFLLGKPFSVKEKTTGPNSVKSSIINGNKEFTSFFSTQISRG